MRRIFALGIATIACTLSIISQAYAVDTGYFTMTKLGTSTGCEEVMVLEGTFSATSCTTTNKLILSNTTSCATLDEPSQKNYDSNKKLLIAAFLSGKEIRATWSSCQGGYASILSVDVCVDSSC